MRTDRFLSATAYCLAWITFTWISLAREEIGLASSVDLGFAERFAFAEDRREPLAELIPGTEDYYFYHCLYYQQIQQFDQVPPMIAQWQKRHSRTARLLETERRQALLTYDRDPRATLAYLKQTLDLNFRHQRPSVNAPKRDSTFLSPELISETRLRERLLKQKGNLNGFTDAALPWLVTASELSANQRRDLLQRIKRADVPGIVDIIDADLRQDRRIRFGQHAVHQMLDKRQLDQLVKQQPQLLNETAFVAAYLKQLQPTDNVDLEYNLAARQQHLDQMWRFARQLSAAHNSLKAHLRYHQLVLDVMQGNYEKSHLLDYLQIPRDDPTLPPSSEQDPRERNFSANLSQDYQSQTLLPTIGDDRSVVSDYLQQMFIHETSYDEYLKYVHEDQLKFLFAETKILNGLGDAEEWYSMISPSQYQSLRDRVELHFPATNRRIFGSHDPIELTVDIKNVGNLIIKVYRINALNYYRDNGKHVSTDINLDGLVANDELTQSYRESPFRRVRHQFKFPKLERPGVYVIDFIGNGQSSRVLIHKGQLRHVVQPSPAGYRFTIWDEAQQPLTNAAIWLAGKLYEPRDDGSILVPYSAKPKTEAITLLHQSAATLAQFYHGSESYRLQTGIHLDRESLRQRQLAPLLVRTGLTLNNTPISVIPLQNVQLHITSVDHDGVSSTTVITDVKLHDDRDFVHQLRVPPRTGRIHVKLIAEITALTTGNKVDLVAEQDFSINQIDKTYATADMHVGRDAEGYLLETLGRTGEALPNQRVMLNLHHRYFSRPIRVFLRSDERGQVRLGELPDINLLTARINDSEQLPWKLNENRFSYPKRIHAISGKSIRLPYMGVANDVNSLDFSLVKQQGSTRGTSYLDHLRLVDGYLIADNLPVGSFELSIFKSNDQLRIHVVDGPVGDKHVFGNKGTWELRSPKLPQISNIDVDDNLAEIQIKNATKYTRVHLFATHFLPEFDPYNDLQAVCDRPPRRLPYAALNSLYVQGRRIGDEYRYVLERRYARKFPGNMLTRPELLLSPWERHDTETAIEELADGEAMPQASPNAAAPQPSTAEKNARQESVLGYANLDFLAEGSIVQLNLKPNAQGLIQTKLDGLGSERSLIVVAVDQYNTVQRVVSLPSQEDRLQLDLRLTEGLESDKQYSLRKQTSLIENGKSIRIGNLGSGRFQMYDSLPKVYQLYETLLQNSHLETFRFVTRWKQMDEEEKRRQYSDHACHELNFFLSLKDPAFFERVIRPHLRNKLHKTFLDRYLLNEDLTAYQTPWSFEQLNVVEKILLADRVQDELTHTQNYLQDNWELIPPDIDYLSRLFDTGLLGQALEETELDAAEALDQAQQFYELQRGLGAGKAIQRELTDESRLGRNALSRMTDRFDSHADFAGGPVSESANFAFAAPREEMLNEQLRLFRQLDKTKEWAENNYFQLPIAQQTTDLVQICDFWIDWAVRDRSRPFQSERFAQPTRSFTEAMFALSVLDLPEQAPEHQTEVVDQNLQIQTRGPVILLHEEIQSAESTDNAPPILVSENFFLHGERQQIIDGKTVDKFVTQEFLYQNVYGCQIVITNPTSSSQTLDILMQIPTGAIPVGNSKTTQSVRKHLEPYHTQTLEYYFYFPAAGDFPHFPVHVTQETAFVASAAATTFHVVEQLSNIDKTSWDFVSKWGTDDDVLRFLREQNLGHVNLSEIAFRMQDINFFESAIKTLRRRHAYDATLWSYAIHHNQPTTITEFLQQDPNISSSCGAVLQSPLLIIDPVTRKTYQHLEYHPLVNARTHSVGQARQILNDRFRVQYQQWLRLLSYVHEIDDQNRLINVYYLLLQDRIEEAIEMFDSIDISNVHSRIQYDYCEAYLSMSQNQPHVARKIAANYKEYPIDRWRNAFAVVRNQLDELDGFNSTPVDPSNRTQAQDKLTANAANFDFTIDGGKIRIQHVHLDQVRIRYYLMDIELLFSRHPFVQQHDRQFAYVDANFEEIVELESKNGQTLLDLPADLANQNVLVEVNAGGQRRARPFYSNAMTVQTIETYGQLKVTHAPTQRPLSTVYCKVYAKLRDGRTVFYKDGYTDLRGRFDYASLSTNTLDSAERFAVLVMSEEFGASVREVAPPKQ